MANIVHCKTDRTINRQIRRDRKRDRGGGRDRETERKDREERCYTLTALVFSFSFIVPIFVSFASVNVITLSPPVRGVSRPLFSVQWGQD